jgi:hypothetical protein
MGKYGTNLEGFGAFEGGVNADNGATLVSTNSDGEKSQLFGPPALREIQAGVANGDFEVVPNDATGAISESNPLPYFSFTDNSSGRIVATLADSTRAPGQTVLRFTLTSALAADEVYFTRYVPITTSEARTYGNQPRVAVAAATNSANYQITWSAQYVRADLSTTTGAVGSTSKSGATMFLDIGADTGAEYQLNPNGTGSAPVDAAYLLLKLSVNATGSVASATLDVAEIRIDRSQIQYLVTDQSLPDSYGPAALYLYQGTLFLSNGGVVGSEPKITISASSGNIGIDATTQGDEITLTGASRAPSGTVTIGTTRPHGFETGYEVIVAGITGVPGTTMNGTFIVTKQTTTVFTYDAAGTTGSGTVTSATVKSGPGQGIIYLKPAATAAGRVQVDGDLVIDGDNSLYVSRVSVASATQSLVNNTSTSVLFDTASTTPTTGTYDPNSWFSNANDWIEIGQDGFYAVTGNIAFAANATGRRILSIIVNGADRGSVQVLASPAATTLLSVSTSLYLASGDQVRLTCLQQSGGALSTVTVAGVYPALSVGRIGA